MNPMLSRFVLVVILTSLLSACSNGTILATVYGRFASTTAKQFKSYANFNKQQTAQIDRLATEYHSWHRSTQLPRYAQWLRSMVKDINNAPLTDDTTDQWVRTVRQFSDDMRTCNPFNVSADFLAGLSDQQVQQIARSMRKDLNEDEDEYLAETAEQRVDRRYKEIRKWGNRSGASFNSQQDELLLKTLTNQLSLGKQRYELRRIWMEQFIVMLQGREQAGFKSDVTGHIDNLWNLTSKGFPEKWQANEALWTGFFRDYIELQTDQQREEFVERALSTAQTLDKIASKSVEAAPVCHLAIASE